MNEQEIAAILSIERKMYTALTEVMELTGELANAIERQDQVSVEMFLSMRQEPINQLTDYRALLKRQCAGLPKEEGEKLQQFLFSEAYAQFPQAQSLEKIVRQNRTLWERIMQLDRRLNQRIGRDRSFYAGKTK